jgi:hypothetical protein
MSSVKKWSVRVVSAVFAAFLASIGVVSCSPDETTNSSNQNVSTEAPAKKAESKQSTADRFKDWVAENGLPTEKTAVKHVTKVQHDDSWVNTADVYTDMTGGMFSDSTQNKARLIASAWADYKQTEDSSGLVTVYNVNGELITNGNY